VGGTPGKPTRLVYARGGVDDNIWLGKTGAAPRVVARSTRRDWSPQLSPNGTRIAFSSTRSGKWAVYVSDLDGKQVSIVADLPNTVVDSPRWSPDGRWIVFAGLERANRDIWIVGADAAGLRRLTSEPSEEGRPAFSADGKWVYFRSDRSGPQEIWKMPSAGGAAQQLTRNGGFEAYESWDGQRMLYVKSRLDLGLWSMPVAGGAETSVLQGVRAGGWAVAENGIVYVDWSEGGRSRGMPIRFATFDGAVSERVLTRGALSATAPYLGASRDASAIVWAELDELEIDVEMIDDFR
jgi:dipeptidyl aminopeptidase/acylaminoacyl peptidase